jgi:hypothetical protein
MSFTPLPTYDNWIPTFELYDSTGSDLIWTFFAVDDTNIPQAPVDTVTITNFRSSGAIVIAGGDKPFEGSLHFWVVGSGYTDVMGQIDTLLSSIVINTPYTLKIGTSASTTISYNVKRTQDFVWGNVARDLRNYRQEITVKLLCNAW